MTDDKSEATFAALFEASDGSLSDTHARSPALGNRVRAQVVQVGRDEVFVEILGCSPAGKRPQGYLTLDDVRGPNGEVGVKPGDVIEAVVVALDPRSGEARLGRTMGKPTGLNELSDAYAARVPVEGKVTGVNKGGLEVEVAGVRAFCPISQADRVYLEDPQILVGRTLQFIVTELRDGGKRVVLSRRAVLEREAREEASKTLARIVAGGTARGTVTSVRDFGAFVDLGGVEGLIPNAELSHDRGVKAADLLAPGDVVEVQVRDIKEGVTDKRGRVTTKITLSLKALAADPWDQVESVAPEGKVVRGSVSRVMDFGAFIRLAPGIEGLLHVSELGGKFSHPSTLLKAGEYINVAVRSIDRNARKISLSPAPEGLAPGAQVTAPSLTIGDVVEARVDHVEPYGVVVQVEGTRGRIGRGVVPNAELGVSRGADTRKLFPAGAPLKAKVLDIGEGRLRLSIRAVKEDEERSDFDGYRMSAVSSQKFGTLGDLLKKSSPR